MIRHFAVSRCREARTGGPALTYFCGLYGSGAPGGTGGSCLSEVRCSVSTLPAANINSSDMAKIGVCLSLMADAPPMDDGAPDSSGHTIPGQVPTAQLFHLSYSSILRARRLFWKSRKSLLLIIYSDSLVRSRSARKCQEMP